MDGFDLTGILGGLGLDVMMVTAVVHATNMAKAKLMEWTWDDKFARVYFLVPFIVAFGLCFLSQGTKLDWALMKSTVIYGAVATAAWRGYKVGIKGE